MYNLYIIYISTHPQRRYYICETRTQCSSKGIRIYSSALKIVEIKTSIKELEDKAEENSENRA